jgi:carboxymethylenebutenolidase
MSKAQSISFPSGAARLNGYLADPEGDGPHPGVVIIHEARGLNDNIKDTAGRFAREGYVALAVDLFSGRNRAACMFRLLGGLLFNPLGHSGIGDLKAALTFLSSQPGVDSARLGAIGFCMGGGLAIAWACTEDRLSVVAPYYATNPRPLEAVARA